jgi:hypothetical protein
MSVGSNNRAGWSVRFGPRVCGVAWSILRGSGLRDASSNLARPIGHRRCAGSDRLVHLADLGFAFEPVGNSGEDFEMLLDMRFGVND